MRGFQAARAAVIGLGLSVGLVACPGDDFGPAYLIQNESASPAIVQFGGTPDDPDTYAYIVPAAARGWIHTRQESNWTGRIAVVDKECNSRWEGRISSDGLLTIASDGTVGWTPGLEEPVSSAQEPIQHIGDLAGWPDCTEPQSIL